MDELFRKDKFQQYSRRLEDAKKSVAEEMYRKSVDEKTRVLETKLSDLSEPKNNVSLFGVLLGMLTSVLAIVFFKHGFDLKWLIVLVSLLGYLLFYRFSMKTAEAKSKLLENYKEEEDLNASFYGKANYLSSQIALRKTRLGLIRIFYMLFFPLFLILLSISRSGDGGIGSFNSIVLAVVLGGLFWYFYFKGDLTELDMTREDLEEIKSKFAETAT